MKNAWSRLCEDLGNRCTFVYPDGTRCDGGIGARPDARCEEHARTILDIGTDYAQEELQREGALAIRARRCDGGWAILIEPAKGDPKAREGRWVLRLQGLAVVEDSEDPVAYGLDGPP